MILGGVLFALIKRLQTLVLLSSHRTAGRASVVNLC